jgi:CheY-like chemotaxis protein
MKSKMAGKKVLVIDDEGEVLQLMKGYLEGLGATVFLADSGEAGVALAETHEPDLILLDLVMPGMSGEEVAVALMDGPETADIPVVLLTAAAEEDDMVVAPKSYGLLSKHLPPDELMEKLKEHLEKVGK